MGNRFIAVFFLAALVLPGACTSGDQTADREKTSGPKAKLTFPVISTGEKVALADHAVDGKHTVFKFTADW